VKCVKKTPLHNEPFTSPLRRIVRTVRFGNNVWGEMRKGIVPVESVQSVVSYLPLPLLSENPSFSNQCSR
jgi:hypothetical protein